MASAEMVGLPDAVLSFRDADGKTWAAGAILGPLVRVDKEGAVIAQCQIHEFAERGMNLSRFTVIEREGDGG
jgi:hypothetical protein